MTIIAVICLVIWIVFVGYYIVGGAKLSKLFKGKVLKSKQINKKRRDNGMKMFAIVVIIVLVVVSLIGGIVITPAGYNNVLLTFGKVDGVMKEGLSLKMPIVQGVVKMSIRTQLFSVEKATAASKDLQDATTSIGMNFRLDPKWVADIYRTVGLDYVEVIVHPKIQEVLKATTAQYNAEDLILRREQVRADLENKLTSVLGERGIIVETINITNFQFSAEFTKAIESKVVAVQAVLEAQNKLERIKVEAQQAEAQAKGEASAAVARAEGQVKAISILSQVLTPEYLQYIYIDRLAKDAKVIIVPEGMPLAITP